MRRFLLAGFLALASVALAEVPIPPLKARVTDLTGTLNADQAAALEAKIAAFEARKGSQIAVLVLPSTKPEEIEQFSIRLAEAWKIGRKRVDDGLILVVAKDDRRLRIEVGYGLEGAIPDSAARRVIDEKITPRFKAGDFFGGIDAGVSQLMRMAEGEKLPPPQPASASVRDILPGDALDYLFLAVVACFVAGNFLKTLLGRFMGSLATGAGMGAIAWLLFSLTIGGIVAFIAFILAFINLGDGRGGGLSSGRGSGWSSGGGWSSSSGSFGGGGGSFGGGGGSFGGGGSSGSW